MLFFVRTVGVWNSSATSGDKPPPCAGFTLTSIDHKRAVMFGGYNGDQGRMNDIYIIDLLNMVSNMTTVDTLYEVVALF